MAKVHSKNSTFTLNSVVLSDNVDDLSLERAVDEAEVTTFASTGKEYVTGFSDNSISFSGPWDGAAGEVDATVAPLVGGAAVTWSYAPASGVVTYSGSCLITGYNIKSSIGGAVTYDATARITGAVTRT